MATSTASNAALHDSHGDAHIHGPSVAFYFAVFIALLALLFLSVGVAYIPADKHRSLLTLFGFTIAGVKGLLIILFFMHVKFGSKLTWLFAFSSFFFLLIMVGLTMNDYGTRIPVVMDAAQMTRPVEPSGEAQGYTQGSAKDTNNAAKSDPTDKK